MIESVRGFDGGLKVCSRLRDRVRVVFPCLLGIQWCLSIPLKICYHQQKNHMSSITSGSSSSNGSNGCFLNLRKQIVVDLVIPEANLF
jgi:hypothetical protein